MPDLRGFTALYEREKQYYSGAHNPKVVGSNPAPATTYFSHQRTSDVFGSAFFLAKNRLMDNFLSTNSMRLRSRKET